MGTLTSWNPLGHSRPVTGLLYLYIIYIYIYVYTRDEGSMMIIPARVLDYRASLKFWTDRI